MNIFETESMSLFTKTTKLVEFSRINNIPLKKCHRLGGKADKFTILFINRKKRVAELHVGNVLWNLLLHCF